MGQPDATSVVVVVVVVNGSGRGGSHNRPGEGSKPEKLSQVSIAK
jgi:hypothetical protein